MLRLSDLTGREFAGDNPEVTGLTADSRDVKPGFIFAALPGTLTDGRKFIDAALEKGAVAVIADNTPLPAALAVPCLQVEDPRLELATLSARFFGRQPEVIVAVTGTNGKTSVAHFTRSLWQNMGLEAASLGTLGIVTRQGTEDLGYTTPEPVLLHRCLADMATSGITHVAIEASSHGLDQRRLDAVEVCAGGFTNLTRDHLDYHATGDVYLEAKLGLVKRVVKPGGTAVLNADSDAFGAFAEAARKRDLKVLTYGRGECDFRILGLETRPSGQIIDVSLFGKPHAIALPLVGEFQAYNALCALGLVVTAGGDLEAAVKALEAVENVPGRMEHIASLANGAAAYVDYAHTPDALETVLVALRPHTAGRIIAVIGCGGNRDTGKRPQMGQIAADHADHVIVTDDNPRNEDPALIRQAIMAACPDATEIGDRKEAIHAALSMAGPGDIVLVAGKGHETGQVVGGRTIPFDDRQVVADRVAVMTGEGSHD
ncbi:UDP-N-acetylmuramoyl-L-alanyl-D-glutamate--2,6-diaminopimelate ligase [Sneathiella chinensis]|uniref:UDP-N-acetylmuramoyl-L-alanyl-D-glutamate--2,6-diaminopimelate ligase n=1 Tax=Sneathiella chinensis TaxID=349750 RepID=A0ABQ5U278_9PROT|nr:UDP-N-acetylmuramoyl-L-alanyl-D-glutamate--2,6-diaminopimelate ligase [Sneathiella chinensis]GLQ05999.1 UDP-N-acetylmuramoyl-L-alanyl-D-glutamate--2,6-diaminopimelate ligase [Sneathiella chinensis]